MRLISSARIRLAKSRPGHEPHRAGARRRIVLQQLHADDVGRHHVGRELDPLETPGENLGDRFDQQRLGQPRHADDQRVPLRKHGRHNRADDRLLPDDHAADLLFELEIRLVRLGEQLQIALGERSALRQRAISRNAVRRGVERGHLGVLAGEGRKDSSLSSSWNNCASLSGRPTMLRMPGDRITGTRSAPLL